VLYFSDFQYIGRVDAFGGNLVQIFKGWVLKGKDVLAVIIEGL
jgi:hypothetical protein